MTAAIQHPDSSAFSYMAWKWVISFISHTSTMWTPDTDEKGKCTFKYAMQPNWTEMNSITPACRRKIIKEGIDNQWHCQVLKAANKNVTEGCHKQNQYNPLCLMYW